ncbi:hypothetical protein X738_22045 [Mesorhizobium sp. LNHC209A00]|nr:hypothetical protein X738_22045 [Mesorhizobium sp. LNHC209A00]
MIALDGADGALVDRASQDGMLPSLTALRARGRVKYLTAHAGATDDALWASFQYASGMGEHGRYHYEQRLRSGKFGLACADEIDRETFWETAPDLRIAVFDIPKCRLPRQFNGIHLADWLVHGRYFRAPKAIRQRLPMTSSRFSAQRRRADVTMKADWTTPRPWRSWPIYALRSPGKVPPPCTIWAAKLGICSLSGSRRLTAPAMHFGISSTQPIRSSTRPATVGSAPQST